MEQSIASARATVLVYDDQNKRWVPAGPSQTQGVSKVHIYQNTTASTYRVVGRKLQDHEVVLNCPILKNLRYNQATATFHQWRDQKLVYGLNFISKEDADAFATAMQRAVEVLVAAHKAKQAQAAAVQQDQASGGYQTIAEQHARKSVSPHAQPNNNVSGSAAVTCANAAGLSSESAYSPQASQRNVNPSQQHAAGAQYSTPCDPNSANNTSLYNPELQTNSCEMEPTAHAYGALPATNAGAVANHGAAQSVYADPQSHALPNGAAQQLRNGTTQVQAQPPVAPPPPAPPVAARPQVASNSAQITSQSGGTEQAEKESSPPEQADALAVALRSVRLKKAADPGAARDAVCNDQAANNKANANDSAKQSAALANDASRNNGGSSRTSLPANSNEVLSEMQRVFAARKARIDATSNEPVNGANLTSASECSQPTTATNTTASTSPKLAARNSNLNANALDAPVTLRELQELKAELVGEIRREIGALKSELVETLRQQVFTNHR